MTLRDEYAAVLENVAKDYHDAFKHRENTRSDRAWPECTTPRCEQFRRLIAAFPGTIAEEMALEAMQLHNLKRRVDAAVKALDAGAHDG